MTRAAKGRRPWALALGLAAVLLAAALPAPATASALGPTYAETRVWAFDLEIPAGVGAERGLSANRTKGYGESYDEDAAGYPLVPRAVPLKNVSGALDDAAAAARTQPHGAFSRIQFGRVQNQIDHAFRHTDAAGLVRTDVQAAITRDLTQDAASLRSGLNVRAVQVNGVDLTVNAYRLPDGTINVGRITTPR